MERAGAEGESEAVRFVLQDLERHACQYLPTGLDVSKSYFHRNVNSQYTLSARPCSGDWISKDDS